MRTAVPEGADSMEVASILGEGMTLIEKVHDREAGPFYGNDYIEDSVKD